MLYDVLGIPIEVGCTIAYPQRQNSSLWLNVGRVTAVHENEPLATDYATYPNWIEVQLASGKLTRTAKLDRVVVTAGKVVITEEKNEP